MSLTNNRHRTVSLLILLLLTTSCTCVKEPKTRFGNGEANAEVSEAFWEKGQLLVRFEPSVEISFFEAAWSILEPEIIILGPKKHGTLKLKFGSDYPLQKVKDLIKSTKGVIHVQENYKSFTTDSLLE